MTGGRKPRGAQTTVVMWVKGHGHGTRVVLGNRVCLVPDRRRLLRPTRVMFINLAKKHGKWSEHEHTCMWTKYMYEKGGLMFEYPMHNFDVAPVAQSARYYC